jgi:hypothetical protein
MTRRAADLTRTRCLVPFCRRTKPAADLAAKGHSEWICQHHWTLVDPRLKRFKRRVERKLKVRKSNVMEGIAYRTWEKLKKQAIERGAGL